MSRFPLLLAFAALSTSASAAEVVWDGHYRARVEAFNNLSLSESNPNAEGTSWSTDHWLRLRPGFLLNDSVAVFTQVDMLPYVRWGTEPVLVIDPVTGEAQPAVYSDALQAPTSTDGGASMQNIRVTRAWGELQTPIGQLRIGRMPVHWGTGMVFNSGESPTSEFGDTSDRVQFTGKVGQVFLMGAWENRDEGFVNEKDDYRGVVGSVYYQNEHVALGTYHTYRWSNLEDTRYTTYIGDLWGEAHLGPAWIQGEFAAIIGGGDLDTGANDLRISSFGANLEAGYASERFRGGLLVGFAGGDADPLDTTLKTFTYDPDFNTTLMLFEEPMPLLEPTVKTDANDGRTTEAVRTGYAISNAVFIKPSVGWAFTRTFTADLSAFLAQQAKEPETVESVGKSYGSEIDLTLTYNPVDNFELQAAGGVLLPGKYFTEYEHEDLGGGFNKPTFGGRMMTTFKF